MSEFTHLHLHTEYSLLDGACDVYKLVDRVAALGQKSVAMTDHGNIYGAVHFFDAAKAKGIKPILGCELYVCKSEDHRGDVTWRSGESGSQGGERESEYNHLLVLAENEEGYRNLIRLTSEASLNGFYRKPRVSKKYLAENCKGLIATSGCLSGELCEALEKSDYTEAVRVAQQYQDIFGKGNFFLEIQDQGLGTGEKHPRRPISPGARAGYSDGGDERLALPVRRGLARARCDAVRTDGLKNPRDQPLQIRLAISFLSKARTRWRRFSRIRRKWSAGPWRLPSAATSN